MDLYFICRERSLGLSGALEAFRARFASANPDVLHRLKALTYFEDAEREPELLMLRPIEWAEVRRLLREAKCKRGGVRPSARALDLPGLLA